MNKINRTVKRQVRVRSKIRGTEKRPRLSVFRSNRFMYAQIINDEKGITIVGASEKELGQKKATKKLEKAQELGVLLAKKAIEKRIKKVVFDKGSYAYHGRVESIAKGAREGGLEF